MNNIIAQDIISVLDHAAKILTTREAHDTVELKSLSDRTIHNASIFQDQDSISVAVCIYALSKLLERGVYLPEATKELTIAADKMASHDLKQFRLHIKRLFFAIGKQDNRLKLYIDQVTTQAQIKKGTKIYDHGISIGQAASLLGISQWELMDYIGKTNIAETDKIHNTRQRLEYARQIFRK